ncbi:hypothetical protein [Marinobacter mobilis]|uniref:Uncharacterized protein n=1 Tax=Marinobacter mobilis TaxID=488533 RepID=A0A1H2ZR74_9GAMM|nr:hypothetical protein [Marinobacter mobilis]SDX20062.1 hypothetical protein SAMN04487960_10741 [Marinobacter mobilis]
MNTPSDDAADERLRATELPGVNIEMVGHSGQNTVKRILFGSATWKLCVYPL